MKEYIERDTAVAFLENMAASRYLIQCFEDKERFPAADVAPVVHGEWKNHNTYVKCSVCGAMPYNRSMFCPNCGARMDGDKQKTLTPRCDKCVHQLYYCIRVDGDKNGDCPHYKRDPEDGGFYG